jgi:hypothetical protein
MKNAFLSSVIGVFMKKRERELLNKLKFFRNKIIFKKNSHP